MRWAPVDTVSDSLAKLEGEAFGDKLALVLAIRLALIVCPETNIATRNNICIKAFLETSVNSIVKLLFTSTGSFTYAHNVLYMLFFASCIHSLKKSQ